jgi:Fe-S oxidoreductase
MGFSPDTLVMDMLGLDHEVPNSGCCGMAGSFGFERGDKYHVSVAVGERLLLPSIRQSAEDTLILADGFSCREQVFQGTGRRALHLAQVITTAIDEAGVGTIGAGTRSGPI